MQHNTFKTMALALSACACVGMTSAHATGEVWDMNWTPDNGFGGLSSVWSLGAAGSSHAAWNVFDDGDPAGPGIYDATPDAGSSGGAYAFVYETGAAGAFLTGGGNIYSFSAATAFQGYLGAGPGGSGARDVALRLETLGTSIAESSVLLDGVAPTSRHRELVGALGGFGGGEEEWVFVWKNVANTGPLNFNFGAAESSLSLAQAAMYAGPVAAIPEPHEWALMLAGLGLVGMSARRARRNKIG